MDVFGKDWWVNYYYFLTGQKWNDPLFRVFLAAINWEFIKYPHLKQ